MFRHRRASPLTSPGAAKTGDGHSDARSSDVSCIFLELFQCATVLHSRVGVPGQPCTGNARQSPCALATLILRLQAALINCSLTTIVTLIIVLKSPNSFSGKVRQRSPFEGRDTRRRKLDPRSWDSPGYRQGSERSKLAA